MGDSLSFAVSRLSFPVKASACGGQGGHVKRESLCVVQRSEPCWEACLDCLALLTVSKAAPFLPHCGSPAFVGRSPTAPLRFETCTPERLTSPHDSEHGGKCTSGGQICWVERFWSTDMGYYIRLNTTCVALVVTTMNLYPSSEHPRARIAGKGYYR
jgi:hypothetical protein